MQSKEQLGQVWQLTRAWTWSIVRDRSTIFWMFLMPLLFVVVFGLAFGRSDVGSYRVGLAVDESIPTGAALATALREVKVFTIDKGSYEHELDKLRDGDRYVVISFGQASTASAGAAVAQQPAEVIVSYDPSRAASVQIVLPLVRQVVDSVDRALAGYTPRLQVTERSVLSDSLEFIDFFLPGIIGFSIMQSGMFAAIPLTQLRETRVLKRFRATPLPRWAVLVSQGLVRLGMALVQMVVLLVAGRLLFDVNVEANWPAVLAIVVLGSALFLALGFAVSGVARTEEAVPALVQVVSFPMMFLSGVFFPVESFPEAVQVIARVLPLTFLGDGLRQVMVGGGGLHPLWLNYLALVAWGAVSAVLAVRLFRWE
jgi:ABC-2 type transport system permease protein